MRADNSHHLTDAARRRRDNTQARADLALQRLLDAGEPVSVARLATEARVSRSWIYAQPKLRAQIEQTQTSPATVPAHPAPVDDRSASAASLRHRLELAHQRIQQLTEDNRRLRDQLARSRGQRRAERQTGTTPTRSTSGTIGPCS